ncbi:RloB family protein [Microcoleus sp. Pol11C2]|uniref:RloB family protein n=1 Tax=Microcoleus sp. Pol11C2 TaxID=3055389 RepID=UPI002FD600A4
MARRKINSRGYSPRKLETKEPKERFLIVCEGSKTEPNYFRSFRVPRDVVEVDVHGLGEDPSTLVRSATDLKNKDGNDYDQIWCVFDRDSWTLENFNNARSSATSQGFRVAYSNEAFELWYILHFEYLNTGIPRKDYSPKLSSWLRKKYEKNSETIYDELLDKQPTAIRNAEKLLTEYDPHVPANDNPSTTVHLLVQELNRFIP